MADKLMLTKENTQWAIGLMTYYSEKGEEPPASAVKRLYHPSVLKDIEEEEQAAKLRKLQIKALQHSLRALRDEDSGAHDESDSCDFESAYDSGYDIESASHHSSTSDHDTQVAASEKRKSSSSQDAAAKRPRLTKFNLDLQTKATRDLQDYQTPSVGSTASDRPSSVAGGT